MIRTGKKNSEVLNFDTTLNQQNEVIFFTHLSLLQIALMLLSTVDTVDKISSRDFRIKYLAAQKPLVIKELSKEWPALTKWNWSYFTQLIGNKKVGLYNNTKSDAIHL